MYKRRDSKSQPSVMLQKLVYIPKFSISDICFSCTVCSIDLNDNCIIFMNNNFVFYFLLSLQIKVIIIIINFPIVVWFLAQRGDWMVRIDIPAFFFPFPSRLKTKRSFIRSQKTIQQSSTPLVTFNLRFQYCKSI